MRPTAKITIEFEYDISQLTVEELRQAAKETFQGFVDRNIDAVCIVNPETGDVYGAELISFRIIE